MGFKKLLRRGGGLGATWRYAHGVPPANVGGRSFRLPQGFEYNFLCMNEFVRISVTSYMALGLFVKNALMARARARQVSSDGFCHMAKRGWTHMPTLLVRLQQTEAYAPEKWILFFYYYSFVPAHYPKCPTSRLSTQHGNTTINEHTTHWPKMSSHTNTQHAHGIQH